MSADKGRHSPSSRARRHFLGAATGVIAKAAVLGALAASISSLPARALGTKWWENGGGSGSNCLLKGTLIETVKGPVAVENLGVGDRVKTVDGSFMPVKWVGWQSHRKTGAEWNENIMPIRIARHAIDGKTPYRDLCVSPNHALFIDGVLIRAKDLVNGRSITRTLAQHSIDYYNIVLDSHAVVMAEGAAVETYLMRGESYKSFTNFAEYQALYGSERRAVMQPFAPILGYEGAREHMHALLCLSGIVPMRDVVEETYQRLSARAGEGVV
ncbi:Hint domain-containing protein [Brucella thiophenivorans]|uniref:Hint domain protein n=1 Tax=Brucella thiophenivorans TaxID=571255 RepID=A0A256FJ11_9HYPH|nr:Hint domain-containing protein [Brucella thiophenivorans]OYR14852.1 hint domain protein [Brucella thiophenivorans]